MSAHGTPLLEQLSRHLAGVSVDRVSPAGKHMAISAIVDTVGVTLAGAAEPVIGILKRTLVGDGSAPEALVFGHAARTSTLNAALINGTAAHAVDYDDMASAMGGHPSVPIVPVVMALGERLGASGRDVLDAYVVGFEAECRIGRAVLPDHYAKGWHPTSTLGVFGAAAAASRMLGLDEQQTTMALALCCSSAAGVKANFGTMTKPFHVGHCARDGLMAAMLARNGFTGSPTALEHKQGFFSVYDGLANVFPDRLIPADGDPLEIERDEIGLKQFPCCGSTHPAILATMDAVTRHGISANDVTRIFIRTHPGRLPHTDNPWPTSSLGAKFSIQYAAVRALIDGAPKLAHFEGDAFREPDVVRLLAVTTAEAFRGQEDCHDPFEAEVTLNVAGRGDFMGRVTGAMGRGPLAPMSKVEMWQKFSDCAIQVVDAAAARAAFDLLCEIDRAENIADLATLLFDGTR